MLAHNELGTLNNIASLTRISKQKNPSLRFHTDASQAMGKIEVNVQKLGVDMLTIAGHKVYAPKGIGALYIRTGVTIEPLFAGASQEHGLRAGTENVAYAVGLGMACHSFAKEHLFTIQQHLCTCRDTFEHIIRMRIIKLLSHDQYVKVKPASVAPEVERGPSTCPGNDVLYAFGLSVSVCSLLRFNAHPHERLPNTSNLSFYGVSASNLMKRFDKYVAVSSGAACHAHGAVTISYVLQGSKKDRS